MAESFDEPGYSADESTKEGFVRLRIKMDGLKVHSTGFVNWVKGNHPLPKGKNAEILNPIISERSLELIVKGDSEGKMKGAQYKLQIRQLPFDIVPEECYILSPDEGWLEAFLKKKDENQIWEKYIRSGILETFEG